MCKTDISTGGDQDTRLPYVINTVTSLQAGTSRHLEGGDIDEVGRRTDWR